ncbi:unnamed protein product [Lepeophtheirus salmonis]|uniref:(salmon louse) hypothetical protein n=1 Tax=Lepeophtheirus salmonis TaxID=72036 RepID=A0A7R8HCX6_LEPSM|nr:unnamed protein product [Lepeophtheirus salmonis]CAF3012062.1 unnamed protein product [Lepeophtheirus salmonis]
MMATNLEIGDPENSHHHHHSSDNDSIHVVKIVNAKKASKIQDKPSAIQNVMDFSNNNRNLDRYSFTCWKCGIGFNVCCDFESHNRAMHPMSEDPNCSSTAEGPSVAKQISSHCTNPVLVKPSTQEQIKPPLKASSPVTNKPCSNKELMNIPPRLDMTVLPTDRNSPSSEPAKPPSSPRITLKQIQSSEQPSVFDQSSITTRSWEEPMQDEPIAGLSSVVDQPLPPRTTGSARSNIDTATTSTASTTESSSTTGSPTNTSGSGTLFTVSTTES